MKDLCVFQAYTLLFQGRKEANFLPAPETWRHNNVPTDVGTALSFISPWNLKQLLHYSLKQMGSWCSRCFSLQLNDFFLVSPQHPYPCVLLQLCSNLQEQITRAQPFAFHICLIPALSLVSYTTTFKGDIPCTEQQGAEVSAFEG